MPLDLRGLLPPASEHIRSQGIESRRLVAAMDLFSHLRDRHGTQMKLREAWPAIEAMASNPDHQHVAIIERSPTRLGQSSQVRMLDVCNRKAPEHVTVKDAHTIYKHLFHEYGQGALLAESNEGVGWKAMMHADPRLPGGRGAAADAHDHRSPPGGRPAAPDAQGRASVPPGGRAPRGRSGTAGGAPAAIDASRGTRPGFRRGPGGRAAPRAGRRLNIATASSRRS